MTDYKKHKEKSPRDTIFRIQEILNRAGIFTVIDRGGTEYEGAKSNRISLYPSKILGQNGKGTDELFATASGYAELLERMQNSALDQRQFAQDLEEYGGFREFPDEKIMSVKDVLDQHDSYLDNLFKKLGCIFPTSKENLLTTLAKEYYRRTDGMINVVPYVEVKSGRIVYLPFKLIETFSLTNGMTAGNSLEEALVQGISEVFERYVSRVLILGNYTPPEIPREYLKNYKLYDLITQIEQSGRYKVSVRDCSLGKNFPVTATIITDEDTGAFGVKFGCHPSFAVSVERTLTEAFQGRTLAEFALADRVGTSEEVNNYHNFFNITKIGLGFYPPTFLVGEPSWNFSYEVWQNWQSETNDEYLKKLTTQVKSQGYSLLIRDSSHMGFNCYHVLIPEIQDVLPVTQTRLREFWTQLKVCESLNHFPQLTDEEENRLLKYLKFKEGSVEGSMGLLFRHYFVGGLMSNERIAAYVSLKRDDYDTAEKNFSRLAESTTDADETNYFHAMAFLAKLKGSGSEMSTIRAAIKYLFRAETAERVIAETSEPEKILQKVFPQLHCFDCAKCSLAGENCEYPTAAELYRKIKAAMSKSEVSQQVLLENLKRVDL